MPKAVSSAAEQGRALRSAQPWDHRAGRHGVRPRGLETIGTADLRPGAASAPGTRSSAEPRSGSAHTPAGRKPRFCDLLETKGGERFPQETVEREGPYLCMFNHSASLGSKIPSAGLAVLSPCLLELMTAVQHRRGLCSGNIFLSLAVVTH